jgi:hypothetical protein
MKGCVRDIVFRNITMKSQQCGCRIKSYSQGTGFVTNITWADIRMTETYDCVTVNAQYKPTPKGATKFIKVSDIHLRNVMGTGCGTDAEFICPEQSPCTEVVLENVHTSGGKAMRCQDAFGTSDNSMQSCLKAGKPPKPTPPTPSPPSPAPVPGCDVDACLARCVSKYGGSISSGAAYMCGKGCCGMKDGKVADRNVYCKLPQKNREAACTAACKSASSAPTGVGECNYGCGYWA